eukprot:TRINITY_DN5079_c0_g1_i10.p1 TRINITY_DN5079_c0_g1~~TRINITY_DN5079_c0_g1_i10.p1  ORF type:complete len:201 (-),score=-8.66 TRINITY_DN5079_c0_g1_i10:24-626(-)
MYYLFLYTNSSSPIKIDKFTSRQMINFQTLPSISFQSLPYVLQIDKRFHRKYIRIILQENLLQKYSCISVLEVVFRISRRCSYTSKCSSLLLQEQKEVELLETYFRFFMLSQKIQFKKQNDSKRRLCQNSSVDLVEVLKTYFNFLNYSSNIFYQILLEKDNVEKDLFQKIVFCNDRQINYICNIGGSRSKGRAETFFLGV